jgi:hypothetical protein
MTGKPPGGTRAAGPTPDGTEVVATALSPELARVIDAYIDTRIREVVARLLERGVDPDPLNPCEWKDGQEITLVGRVRRPRHVRDPFSKMATGGSTAELVLGNRQSIIVTCPLSRRLLDCRGRRVRVEGRVHRAERWEWPRVYARKAVALDDPPGGAEA